jgi:Flp pilus assembly protein TadG
MYPGHKERGQSFVELAVSLVVILFVLAGAVDFGRAYFAFISLRDASQEGALFAAIDNPKDTTDITNRIRTSSAAPVNLADTTTVTIGVVGSGGKTIPNLCAGDTVTVTVTYQFPIIMPLSNLIFPSSTIPLVGETAATVLTPPCP